MKRILLFGALCLATAGSWAFYPHNTAPEGYMMVVGSGRPGTTSSVPEITVIQPDGQRQVQRLPKIKIGTERNSTAAATEIHRFELLKVNSLLAQGWRVAHVTQSTVGVGATTETVYLLERP
ncbi:hypothetical protein E4631_00050 [Hymenobacter sp. UV11]|uniref:hypothetical protein n=1 Tax=Hymenobacter sp. UV11 TaxID=1849735 RepID=UPI00105D4045|nr:hypothetical protein [Hymenobacter sp. UV11]TDN37314.1 hypothetical protein A8B98_01885 [Hymenobacter sp. UV11]TFZ68501.1 hypothetical protein E4631_00050 [Hymenobacter sp. UV11]